MIKKIFLVMLISTGFVQKTYPIVSMAESNRIRAEEAAALAAAQAARRAAAQAALAAQQAARRAELAAQRARERFLERQRKERESLQFEQEESARKDLMYAYDQASTAILALMDQAKKDNPEKFRHQRNLVGNVTPAAQTPNCFYMPEEQRRPQKRRPDWNSDSE